MRARGDRGVALVEAVFVLPVVLTVVFAIFEFGLLFAAQSTTNSATRDGVRFGSADFAVAATKQASADAIALTVAKDLGARTNLDTPIKLWIYKADANGFPSTGNFSSCTNATPCDADTLADVPTIEQVLAYSPKFYTSTPGQRSLHISQGVVDAMSYSDGGPAGGSATPTGRARSCRPACATRACRLQ